MGGYSFPMTSLFQIKQRAWEMLLIFREIPIPTFPKYPQTLSLPKVSIGIYPTERTIATLY